MTVPSPSADKAEQARKLSGQPRRNDGPVDLAAARARFANAHDWVADLCTGKRQWRMRVPVDVGDSDITISDALIYGERLADEVEMWRARAASGGVS